MDQSEFFYMITTSSANTFVENAVFFPLDGFNSFVKDQVTIDMWVNFWFFNSSPVIYLLSLYQYHAVFITIAL